MDESTGVDEGAVIDESNARKIVVTKDTNDLVMKVLIDHLAERGLIDKPTIISRLRTLAGGVSIGNMSETRGAALWATIELLEGKNGTEA